MFEERIEEKICEKLDPKLAQEILRDSVDTYCVLYGWQYKNQPVVEIYPEEFETYQQLERRLEQIVRGYDKHNIDTGRSIKAKDRDFIFYVLYKKTLPESVQLEEAKRKHSSKKNFDPLFNSVEDMKRWVKKHQKGLSPFATLTQDVGDMNYNNALFNAANGSAAFTSGGSSADGAAMTCSGGLGEGLTYLAEFKKSLIVHEMLDLVKPYLQESHPEYLRIYDMLAGPYEGHIAEFTQLLHAVDIDPLPLMPCVPYQYLFEANVGGKLVLPDNIKFISNECFTGTNIQEVVFNEGLEFIGFNSFSDTRLKSVKLPTTCYKLESWVFSNCFELTHVDLCNVEIIDDYAFGMCTKLKTIRLPQTLKALGDYIFEECTDLERIEYDGTLSQFENVRKSAYSLTLPVYCRDGICNNVH